MSEDNESQPGDAVHKDTPGSSHEAAAATNGAPRNYPTGRWGNTNAPTVTDALSQSDHGIQHLTTLLEQSASELDLEVNRLKDQRTEAKKARTRLAAQIKNSERKRRRLVNRARQLSTNDLLEVYAIRVRASTAKGAQDAPAAR